MKFLPFVIALIFLLAVPVSAMEVTAPEVPESGADLMPRDTGSFWQGLCEILRQALISLRPDLAEASRTCLSVAAVVLLLSLLNTFPGIPARAGETTLAVAIGALLLRSSHSLIALGRDTVTELSEYGKLLLSVMTTAMAAQGAVTTSGALYVGSAAFNALLSAITTRLLVPMVYVYLALSVVNSAIAEAPIQHLADFLRQSMVWSLKTVLYIFTGYMSITGVVSGTTDAATLKATKLTISGMVPLVGGILSDASEAVLVSAGLAKNAAGIYGLLALLALLLGPFLRIGTQYLFLKLTGLLCGIFGSKGSGSLIDSFTTAMGLLLAMTGAVCLMLMISTVCFLREVG